ncbi:MAG: DNA adenine methylase [Aggregatilineales bacterium]
MPKQPLAEVFGFPIDNLSSDAQLSLLEDNRLAGVINVASVPQRSVFRYPGGKTWFVPYLRKWLRSLPKKPAELIEPFAGGGIVGLTAAFENLVEQVTLVELDPQVAAVWHTVLSTDATWLAERIVHFDFTPTNVEAELARSGLSRSEVAFQTILKNRVNRGGIMAAGAGRIKTGESNKGLASRWYPQTLGKRILEIATLKDRFRFVEGDGIAIMRQHVSDIDTVFFIDPPYTAGGKRAGSRLYNYNEIDHEMLFAIAGELGGHFLMTYDNTQTVQELARKYDFSVKAIAMKNTHHAQLTELLISRDVNWLA